MRTLLSIDPGLATGFAVFTWDETAPEIEPSLVYSDELDGSSYYRQVLDAFTNAEALSTLEVVVEEFKITAATGKLTSAPWSLKRNGFVEGLCSIYDVAYTEQPPSRAKNFVPNERLRALGFWHVGGAGHANDAIRHGVLYFVEKHNWRPARLLVSDDS